MPFELQPRFYAHVPVYHWPWVLWQILVLTSWSKEHGRDIAFSVNSNGRVYLDHVADDPSLWKPEQVWALLPGKTVWEACSKLFAFDPARTGDSWVFQKWLYALLNQHGPQRPLIGAPTPPQLQDSS